MGTYNLRKGKGHVRIDGDSADTATCLEAVFQAAGIDIPAEGAVLQVMVVKHPNGQKEVVQVISASAGSSDQRPFVEVRPEGNWVRASYRGFNERRGLGTYVLDDTDTLAFAFQLTLERTGFLDLPRDSRVEVRVGKTDAGTPIVADIRRIA